MSLGARLREQRERQNIPLRAIADETKIKLSLLEGLERDDVSQWPGGIFRRAYVRAYAQAIGLQPDLVVREFLDQYPDPDEDIVTAVAAAVSGGEPTRPMARLRAAVGATFRARPAAPPATPPSPKPEPVPARPIEEQPQAVQPAVADSGAAPTSIEEPDLATIARLCTALACVEHADELTPLLADVAHALDAAGLIVWLWDSVLLRPSLVHGYSPNVLEQLPSVDPDAHNATAAAFRLAQTCIVEGSRDANGAIAAPLMTAAGCGGVLAIELRRGRERSAAARAAAEIVSAQLAAMMRIPGPAAADRRLA